MNPTTGLWWACGVSADLPAVDLRQDLELLDVSVWDPNLWIQLGAPRAPASWATRLLCKEQQALGAGSFQSGVGLKSPSGGVTRLLLSQSSPSHYQTRIPFVQALGYVWEVKVKGEKEGDTSHGTFYSNPQPKREFL